VRPLPFVWPYAAAFWLAFLWAFAAESRIMGRALVPKQRNPSHDAGSFAIVIVTQGVAMFLAIFLAFRAQRFAIGSGRIVMFWCGLALLIAGATLRRHCFRMLGQYFTADVRVRADQPVVEIGAYRVLRHPSYTAGLLMFAGVASALGNWASLVVLVGLSWLGYLYRVRVEERALLATIGESYRAYMRRTKRFIPYVI
jgi:protein-S-isoprenylcysteine O-methyltransferase Ste14